MDSVKPRPPMGMSGPIVCSSWGAHSCCVPHWVYGAPDRSTSLGGAHGTHSARVLDRGEECGHIDIETGQGRPKDMTP